MAEQKCIEKLFEKTVGDVQVSQEEIDEYYNEELYVQKEEHSLCRNKACSLYEPEKVRVKHVAIEIPSEKTSQYLELMNDEKEEEAKELLDKELEAIRMRLMKYWTS